MFAKTISFVILLWIGLTSWMVTAYAGYCDPTAPLALGTSQIIINNNMSGTTLGLGSVQIQTGYFPYYKSGWTISLTDLPYLMPGKQGTLMMCPVNPDQGGAHITTGQVTGDNMKILISYYAHITTGQVSLVTGDNMKILISYYANSQGEVKNWKYRCFLQSGASAASNCRITFSSGVMSCVCSIK